MEKRDSANLDGPDARESAERFWHLDRGMKLAFVLVFLTLVFVLAFRRTGYDIHLDAAYGRMVAREGLGAFSGQSSLREEMPRSGWLWWLVSFGLVRLAGVRAVALFAALLATAGFGVVLAALARRLNVVVAGLLLVVAAGLVSRYLAPGSQTAGIFLFGALAALLAGSLRESGRKIWWAVPLMILYVNIDISWPAGFALCAFFVPAVVSSKAPSKGAKCAALAVALAATLLNPDFLDAWRVLRLPVGAGSPQAWISPLSGAVGVAKSAGFVLAGAGVLLGALSLSAASVAFAVTSTAMILMGLGVANFAVFAISAAAAIASALPRLAEKLEAMTHGRPAGLVTQWVNPLLLPGQGSPDGPPAGEAAGGRAAVPPGAADAPADASADESGADWARMRMICGLSGVLGVLGLLVVLALVASAAARSLQGGGGPALPEKAVSFVIKHDISGLALVPPQWSGYLLWRTGADTTVVADGRPMAASPAAGMTTVWAFGWIHLRGEPAAPLDRLGRWGVSFALAPQPWSKAQDFTRGGWRPVYWDDVSAVLVPAGPGNAELVARYDRSLTYPPLFSVGSADEQTLRKVMTQLEDKLAREGESAYARYELAVCNYVGKKYSDAEAQLILALGIKEEFADAWHLWADLRRLGGDDEAAIAYYGNAVRYQQDNAMAYLRLGELLLKRGDWANGIKSLTLAQAADDRRPQLDKMGPGLRKRLDERVREQTTLGRPVPPGGAGEPGESGERGESGEPGEAGEPEESERAPSSDASGPREPAAEPGGGSRQPGEAEGGL